MLKQLIQEESGNSALEYGLIAALIAVAIIIAVTNLGGKIRETFET
ncbi:MAG: Flp family type IVb pilin, partial [Firmicutes bacterium]|nr:Flp family type IVb pilin [Bacillota bacterium]